MDKLTRLLLVDDDPLLCQVLADYLTAQGFRVSIAHDGESALIHLAEHDCDLVLLDDSLPGLSSLDVLRRIRGQGELAVVMLAAGSDEVERIVGLEMGADDYISKSCHLRELLARARSILRRARNANTTERARGSDIGVLSISSTARTASWRGKTLRLTSTEFNLLELLFANPGRPVGKAELALSVLGREMDRYDRSLDMHISNLRKKLGKLADGRSPIQVVRGAGYQLLRNHE